MHILARDVLVRADLAQIVCVVDGSADRIGLLELVPSVCVRLCKPAGRVGPLRQVISTARWRPDACSPPGLADERWPGCRVRALCHRCIALLIKTAVLVRTARRPSDSHRCR